MEAEEFINSDGSGLDSAISKSNICRACFNGPHSRGEHSAPWCCRNKGDLELFTAESMHFLTLPTVLLMHVSFCSNIIVSTSCHRELLIFYKKHRISRDGTPMGIGP